MSEAIRLSVEETNKLRAQLGLPLLPTQNSNPDQSNEQISSRNSKSQSGKSLSIQETNLLRRSLGLKLLDEDNSQPSALVRDGSDAKLNNNDELGPKTADSELKNGNNNFGMKVGHSAKQLAQLNDGDVFFLEDKDILDDTDDVFVNADLVKQQKQESRDRERAKLGLGSRSSFPGFEEESDPEDDLQQLTIIGSTIQIPEKPISDSKPVISGNVTQLSGLFDDLEPELKPKSSKIKTSKFKKPKGSSSRKRTNDDYQDVVTTASKMVTSSLTFEEADSDDIEASLAKARQKKAKIRSQMTPAEIAAEARTHYRLDVMANLKDGLVFDQTKDFLDNLSSKSIDHGGAELENPVIETIPAQILNETESSSSEKRNGEIFTVTESNSTPSSPSLEEPLQKAKDQPSETNSISHEAQTQESATESNSENEDVLEAEIPKFGSVSSTLKYLRQTAAMTSEADKRANKFKHEKFKEQSLIRMKISAQERIVKEELLNDVNYNRLSPEDKERIYDETLSRRLIQEKIITDKPRRGDRYSSAPQTDDLKDYNPQVHIQHKDEAGQVMDQKQAWKALSHRYHGLAPKKVKRTKMKSRAERTIN